MPLAMARYTCANCRHDYRAPALGETTYGEFLLWSAHGAIAYLNAFEDPTYEALGRLIDSHPDMSAWSQTRRADVLRSVYGTVACDRDAHGSVLSIDAAPPCPACGAQSPASWQWCDPPERAGQAVPAITHAAWAALSDAEQRDRLDRALARWLDPAEERSIAAPPHAAAPE